jgi:hypothetical protein
MEVPREMIYQEALKLQEATACLRAEARTLEVMMERIEAIGLAACQSKIRTIRNCDDVTSCQCQKRCQMTLLCRHTTKVR